MTRWRPVAAAVAGRLQVARLRLAQAGGDGYRLVTVPELLAPA